MFCKMEYFVKAAISRLFTILIVFPSSLVYTLKRCFELYKEDPNNLLDEYLKEKWEDRIAKEIELTKIYSFGERLANWADASYC